MKIKVYRRKMVKVINQILVGVYSYRSMSGGLFANAGVSTSPSTRVTAITVLG